VESSLGFAAGGFDESLSAPSSLGLGDGLELARSFLAQPEPLKTMAGAETALRTGPPHALHVVGPSSCTPWITSTRVPQTVQA
jgi:hypothetical protein